ncbi:MAG: translation initiation factor IF-3 [Actinomycetota bacterium]|nr:MAG: translation initiation factor IF-3 [Actinomycetota bacterium]
MNDKRTRVNENIRVPEVRLIDEDGNQIGIVSSRQALEIADEKGLDLVEISPNGKPPVCKIMDFGKYKYQLEISEKLKKKKQSHIVVKEIKLRPKIDKNDLNTKKRQMEKFLKHGNKVKVTIMFRGREIVHKQLGMNILESLLEDLRDIAVVELRPKLDGYNMIMVIAPV